MSRLTINLDDDLHRALKEASARQGRSISSIIEESLLFRGIKPMESARRLVELSRSGAGYSHEKALNLAVAETRKHRGS